MSLYEPNASSTCELVTEMMQELVEQSDILPVEADAVLSGIVLDTKSFTLRTGERTFDAAAFLRRAGADPVRVKKMFQSGLDETLERYDIMKQARLYRGVAVSAVSEAQNRVVAAQAADELLTVAGVSASVVLYPTQDGRRGRIRPEHRGYERAGAAGEAGRRRQQIRRRRPDAGHVSAGRGQPALRRHRQLLGYGLRP